LSAQIDRLCEQREVNAREAQYWMTLTERAVRTDDDVTAKEALTRHAEHLKQFYEADAELNEFRALLTDVIRLLPMRERSANPDANAG
jgi:phage shock protein A